MYADNAKLNRCKKLLETPVKVNRNREPPKCRLCAYYQPDFRYRRCLFSACPYVVSTQALLIHASGVYLVDL